MSVEAVAVRLSPDASRRIEAVSAATGRPVADVAREAIEDGLDQVEYVAMVEAEAAAARRGEISAISQDELKRRLGDD